MIDKRFRLRLYNKRLLASFRIRSSDFVGFVYCEPPPFNSGYTWILRIYFNGPRGKTIFKDFGTYAEMDCWLRLEGFL